MNNLEIEKSLIDIIKEIDTSKIVDSTEDDVTTKILEEQKTYFWIRIFLNDEENNIEIGDDVSIKYEPSGEELLTKFVSFGKVGLDSDQGEQMKYYDAEDDKRVLCLMVDESKINDNDNIPFIRTLFKNGRYFEYQIIRRNELLFINKRNNVVFEYYDCSF